jgi:hypothetical protein
LNYHLIVILDAAMKPLNVRRDGPSPGAFGGEWASTSKHRARQASGVHAFFVVANAPSRRYDARRNFCGE